MKTCIVLIGALLLAGQNCPCVIYRPFSYQRPASSFAKWGLQE